MAPVRSLKTLVSRRRRSEGDDEDDESVTMADDMQSELSAASDLDEGADADADASDISDTDTTEPMVHDSAPRPSDEEIKNGTARSKRRRKGKKARDQSQLADKASPVELTNGSNAGELTIDSEAAQVQDTHRPDSQAASGRKAATLADKRRREHEEYKKKRDSDPTFIPNRGGFFMHDARIPDQRGFSHFARGRGRGRGGLVGAPTAPPPYVLSHPALYIDFVADLFISSQVAPSDHPADANWKHDLHETINEPDTSTKPSDALHDPTPSSNPNNAPPRPLNFSKTVQIGKVHIRVLLPGTKAPVVFSDVPVRSHARLPDHRPPLRRDKPVRISLPDNPPRYRFPSSERSFIFIPRALRPNQQGFGRARGSFGAYVGPASRRTSMYGGSVYSPSVSMSRRSSLARDISRDSAFSPTGSYVGRPPPQSGRPVVRLPHAGSHRSSNASPAGSVSAYARGQSYPLPQKPAVEHWAEPATMYQPRPQKTISVTGIESPAGLGLHAPQQQDQQPFHSQLPQHMGENGLAPQHAPLDPSQQSYYAQPYAYPGGASTGTPLSNIPERAVHAQPFQPVPAFYPQQYPAQGYYYGGQAPQYPQMPAYAQPVQSGYAPAEGSTAAGAGMLSDMNQAQPGTVAYETNGMVYYQDAAPMPQYPQQDGYYQAPVFGMGGMMTPGPEGNYYYPQVGTGPVYYPQS